ncbi:discoidin domain-containing protein [Tessaracoccus flavus]|uniref:F5/8 type C domain-containing protein n=1 Tax=Tessaracoccus flavus TaxID=1610493 RepID=A0A1Q2CBN0_9ACTN|nr:discoidin domain-containing protein [Tessaracoccus flavus]AQP43516.1 hypothetical protein RPIT_00690 [Tessaracoccus flavus]
MAVSAAAALAVAGLAFPQTVANAAYEYTPISQDQMSVVEVDSVELTGEGTNGPGELALDGNIDTYWHTKWQGGIDPLPHHITVKLADEAVSLGRVHLTPRQSSNGSGRVHEYELHTAVGDCETATYAKVAEGSFPGEVATYSEVRTITLDEPVDATCAKVVYLSSWGGAKGSDPISPVEQVATLAEFNADTATDSGVDPTDPVGWAFNNLTYLPFMTRAQWANNPLGYTGTWTATDGSRWRTECDTALTGKNTCRTFRWTTVYNASPKPGGWLHVRPGEQVGVQQHGDAPTQLIGHR